MANNFVVFSGVVGKDPAYYKEGTIGKLNIAISQGKDDKGNWRPSVWVETAVFKDAVSFIRDIRKGDYVVVTGKLSANNYTSKTGQKIEKITVMAYTVDKINRKAAASRTEEPEERDAGSLPWEE